MGKYFCDQYSYLHFASGILSYFWNISFQNWIILQILFELFENTTICMKIINNNISFWPGGKVYIDSLINQFGDIFFGTMGWLTAYYLDKLGKQYNWYPEHL